MADERPKRPQKPRSSSRPPGRGASSGKPGGSRGPKRDDRGRSGASGETGSRSAGKPGGGGGSAGKRSYRSDKSGDAPDGKRSYGSKSDGKRSYSSDKAGSPRSGSKPPAGQAGKRGGKPGFQSRSDRPAESRGGDPRSRRPRRDDDPRSPRTSREERHAREPREDDLPWPEEIFDLELEPELRAELEAVGGTSGTLVKHLLSVQVLAEDDPEQAHLHAQRLRERIPRSALARQTACIAAYRAGHYRDAIKEEAAYRRTSSRLDLVPIAADCERGLGRPERALALVTEFEGQKLDADTLTELLIVAGGAREDLGDVEAARMQLQKAIRVAKSPMATARSRFALGKLLLVVDPEQSRKWLESASHADPEGIWTDAEDLLEEL